MWIKFSNILSAIIVTNVTALIKRNGIWNENINLYT